MPTNDQALAALRLYLQEEPTERLRAEAMALLSDSEVSEDARAQIWDRFGGDLSFGTAGMRGKMEAGTRRLNPVTVSKAAFAIGSTFEGEGPIVVGYDARENSADFAEAIAEVLGGLGIEVCAFDEPVATPLCAFAVPYLKARAGVMVTASHNPPCDNGIKVYGPQGAQIVSPFDKAIEQKLKEAPRFKDLPRSHDRRKRMGSEVVEAYYHAITETQIDKNRNRASLKVVYTPLHGVGYRFVRDALANTPYVQLVAVEAQKNPDGRFPTVSFPNPEEEGALDLAVALAKEVQADLIIANDPDADRLAVALPDKNGQYRMLSGNEVGAILGCNALENGPRGDHRLVMSTLVSSRLLSAMAKANGAHYVESLTGFARIAKEALSLEQKGYQFLFGFEEALGYAVGSLVRDKDGICAAVRLLERAALLKAEQKTLRDELDRIALKYGVYCNTQWSLRFSGPQATDQMQALMQSFRQNMDLLFGLHVERVHDFLKQPFDNFPMIDLLIFSLEDDTRLVIRPSGTEPKVKFYVEKSGRAQNKEDLDHLRAKLNADINSIKQRASAV